jgi:HPr kinase/phosphorylase
MDGVWGLRPQLGPGAGPLVFLPVARLVRTCDCGRMTGEIRTLHASAAARDGAGVLLLGPPGSGKSDLLLRLIHHGFTLVADDQVQLNGLHASAPKNLAGLLEVRGLGIARFPYTDATLMLAVNLAPGPRLPEPKRLPDIDLCVINLDPGAASAPLRVALALDCLQGKIAMTAGAFA